MSSGKLNSLRALIFSQYYWPEDFRINEVASTLSEKGIEIEVLTGKPNYPRGIIFDGYRAWGCQQESHQGILIHRIPLLERGVGGLGLRLALNYLSFVISGVMFSPWVLRGKRFDVIFVNAPSPILQAIPAIFLGWLKGCPVVLWVQDLWPESLSATGYVKNKVVLKFIEHVVRFIYRHVDLLLVQSEAFIRPVKALAPKTSVRYYPNSAADLSLSLPYEMTAPEIPGLEGDFSVMFAGNIGTAQGVGVIIEAADLLKEHSEIHFIVLGDGSRWDWMVKETKSRNLTNIHLPGRFSFKVMPRFMRKASVLLVTLADQEIFNFTVPSKVQAYLAAGRPILGCLNGEGANLIVASGAGLVVPAENAKALAEAILQMYRMSPQEREAMGAKGRLYYMQHFSHDKLIDRLIDLFNQCITVNKEKLG